MPLELAHGDVATWLQAIMQGGALAVVGLLVRWTMRQVPRWLQAAREEREAIANQAREERAIVIKQSLLDREAASKERLERDRLMQEVITLMQDKFDERTKEVTGAIRLQTRELTVSLKDQSTGFSRSLESSALRIESAVAHACKAELVHRRDPKMQVRPRDNDDPAQDSNS